eukprot:5204828-Amphidinium_carterae.1
MLNHFRLEVEGQMVPLETSVYLAGKRKEGSYVDIRDLTVDHKPNLPEDAVDASRLSSLLR